MSPTPAENPPTNPFIFLTRDPRCPEVEVRVDATRGESLRVIEMDGIPILEISWPGQSIRLCFDPRHGLILSTDELHL